MPITVFGMGTIEINKILFKENYMKKLKYCTIFSVVAISLILFSTGAQAIPIVSLELSTTDIYVGDAFTIDVVVDGVTDIDSFGFSDELLSFGFDVDYLASECSYNGAEVNVPAFFDDSSLFPDTDVAGSALPAIGGDDILLATLSFTPLLAGDFFIGIISDIFDLNEGLILLGLEDPDLLSVDITQSIGVNVSPVPEPATILLLVSGMAGLGVFGRKKFKK